MSSQGALQQEGTQSPPAPIGGAPLEGGELSAAERSCLMYLETCVVDAGGIVEAVRMNADDMEAVERFRAWGWVEFARIPSCLLEERYRSAWSHIVLFRPTAWTMAHQCRMRRGAKHGPFAEKAVAELRAMGKFAPPEARSAADGAGTASTPGDSGRSPETKFKRGDRHGK
jgi:hypothetical protein